MEMDCDKHSRRRRWPMVGNKDNACENCSGRAGTSRATFGKLAVLFNRTKRQPGRKYSKNSISGSLGELGFGLNREAKCLRASVIGKAGSLIVLDLPCA